MSFAEKLTTQFETLNVTVAPKVLQKCEELCTLYNIDPEDFIDLWFAYTASNLNGAPPTLDTLDQLERKELKKLSRPISSNTPKPKIEVTETTPVRTPARQNLQKEMEEESQMEITTQATEDFQKRDDACSVQRKFGDCDLDTFKERHGGNLMINIQNKDIANCKYMYETFSRKQEALNAISRFVTGCIIEHYKLELSREKLIKKYSGEVTICGRIYSETVGRLEPSSIQLAGLLDVHKGQHIKLNFKKLERMSLFNGQSVVLTGYNDHDWFSVKEIFTGAPLHPPETPLTLEENLQIIVAAGPFTLPENLMYEPLDHLLKYVIEFKPNLLILMGPFLDRGHKPLDTLCETYESFFESMVEGIMERLKGTGVQVVLVPSHKDIHNHVIFPTLPYTLQRRYENLHLAPNPFSLNIEGLILGGSTADILFHLSKVDCSKGAVDVSRIARLLSHVFNQRSFYPLHPPDADISVDYQLVEQYAMFETAPDIMFLPSNFGHFVRVAENSVVVNPERLTKGNVAGTFARVEIRAKGLRRPVSENVSCQIYRV